MAAGVVKSVPTSKADSQLVTDLSQAFALAADSPRRSLITKQTFLELVVLNGAMEDVRCAQDPQNLRQLLIQMQSLHVSWFSQRKLMPKAGRWEPKATICLIMAEAAIQIIKEKPREIEAMKVVACICQGDGELAGLIALLSLGKSNEQMDPSKNAAVAFTNWARRLLLEEISDHDLSPSEPLGTASAPTPSSRSTGEAKRTWSPSDGFRILEDHLWDFAAEWNSKLRQITAEIASC
jgi:hypothetical protein